MDYEKKYKEALERANKYNFDGAKQVVKDLVFYIFPELNESKDEKIRKEIIETFKNLGDGKTPVDINYADIFTWLEKQGKQKPTGWSEEDEWYMSGCIGAIATKDGWSFEEKRKTKHWLKSLEDRYTWKPSDEQMKALHDLNLTGNISYAGQGQVLIELYNDLKKLTE